MTTREFKTDCALDLGGQLVRGVAHVIEVEYSDRVRFCCFVMQVTPGELSGAGGRIGDVGLVLSDGRTAVATITHFKAEANYCELVGASGGLVARIGTGEGA